MPFIRFYDGIVLHNGFSIRWAIGRALRSLWKARAGVLSEYVMACQLPVSCKASN